MEDLLRIENARMAWLQTMGESNISGAGLIAMQLHLPSPLCYPRDLPVRLQVRVSAPSAAWPTAAISLHLEQQLTVYGPPYHGLRPNVIRRAELVRERDVGQQRWLDFDLGLATAKPSFVHTDVGLEVGACHWSGPQMCSQSPKSQYWVVVRILADGHPPRGDPSCPDHAGHRPSPTSPPGPGPHEARFGPSPAQT
jgi:hypothetical protein